MRVVTYNVHRCVGTDGRKDVGRIAGLLRDLDADVYLLQEVDDLRALAAACGPHYQHVAGATLPSGYGNAVLVRGRILDARPFNLSVAGREPRGCLQVDAVCHSGTPVTASVVHLGLARGERRRQVDQLLELFRGASRLVLGGDFNDWPPGPTRLLGRAFLDAAHAWDDLRATFPTRLPLLRLDRLYSLGLSLARYRVHRCPVARVASDHLPVVADYGP